MKKIISYGLMLLLVVFTACQISMVAFAADPTFSVSTVSATPGEKVSVTISLVNNPGIASAKLRVQFDEALQLTKVTYNNDLGGQNQKPQKLTSPVTLNWFNGEANTEGDMVYATLDFTVSESASAGNHPISVTYNANDVYNITENNITFAIENGGVNVVINPTGIDVDKETVDLDLAGQTTTATVSATIAPAGATGTIKATSSDTSVATVTDAGVITALKKGTATVTFKVDGTSITKTVKVNVTCSHKPVETAEKKYEKTAGDCVTEAVYFQHCELCDDKLETTFNGKVDPNNHKGPTELVDAKAATHFEDGFTGNEVCKACGVTVKKGEAIKKGEHTWNKDYSYDSENHWIQCSEDSAVKGESEPHDKGEWVTVKAATYEEEGLEELRCTVCGAPLGESRKIDKLVNYTDTESAEFKEETPADVVITTTNTAAAPKSVKIGSTVLTSEDYTVEEGKITIKAEALKKLDGGDYDVVVEYEGGAATVALKVTKAATPTPAETQKPAEETKAPETKGSTVPETGVESHLGLWIALLVLAASGIAVFSYKRKESK